MREQNYGPQVYYRLREKESKKYKTVWSDSKFDASTHGTELVNQIIGTTNPFDYPKSVYLVVECLKAATLHRKDALILDFFAGSGTTFHATELLNFSDSGSRQCILVTNNEVSDTLSKNLQAQELSPGDPAWEQQGICRSVTWPRSKYTILGRRDDGTTLDGDYLTGKSITKERPRRVQQIGFVNLAELNTAAKKKQLVALIDGIPQSLVKADSVFIVSETHSASILFDETQTDAWLEALEDQEHITDLYIVAAQPRRFNEIKEQVTELLGPITITEEEKRPMAAGFTANLEYFKLDFLDKDQVALGQQFGAILPLLWLRAGAIGPRPEVADNEPLPAMLLPTDNPFGVLIDESRFADFQAAVAARSDLTHLFLVTDSEEAFQEMAAQLSAPDIIQLYRDYLENFLINKGDRP